MARRGRRPSYVRKAPGTPYSRALQRARTQSVTPIPQGNDTFRVQSSSHVAWYQVQRQPGGSVTCSCPAGAHGHFCKHVAAVYLIGRRLAEPWQWEAPWVGGTEPWEGRPEVESPGTVPSVHEDEYGVYHPHD